MQSFPTKESLELSSAHTEEKGLLSFRSASGTSAVAAVSPSAAAELGDGGESSAGGGAGSIGGRSFGAAPSSTSLYLKTISQSLRDQQYLLSPFETNSRQFQWIQKLVYFTTLALRSLCKDAVPLAHFGITGLNKLVPRENHSHKFTSNVSKGNLSALMGAPSYMVATNSLNQGLEETLLTDVKMELNCNKWTRFLAVADVVAISLHLGHESVKRLTKVTSNLDSNGGSRAGSQKALGFGAPSSRALVDNSTGGAFAGASASSSGGGGNVVPLSTTFIMSTPTSPPITPQLPNVSAQRVSRAPSMFRSNSLKENNTDAEYSKSKRVSANIMSQLLLDWLETRRDSVFEAADVTALSELWHKHYPNFGSKFSCTISRTPVLLLGLLVL